MKRSILVDADGGPLAAVVASANVHDTKLLAATLAGAEARPEALHPRAATVAVVLLRNEYVTRGTATVSDDVLVEIVDEVYLPLVRGRGAAPSPDR